MSARNDGSVRAVAIRRRLRLTGTALAAFLLGAAGVATARSLIDRPQVVFETGGGNISGPIRAGEYLDIVVELRNVTGQPVRLVGMSLAGPPAGVRTVGTSAYNRGQVGDIPVPEVGDLPRECPRRFDPSPVTSVLVRPHKVSGWYGIVTIQIRSPGTYYIQRLKIRYLTPAGYGWQYWSVGMTLYVHNPPISPTVNVGC